MTEQNEFNNSIRKTDIQEFFTGKSIFITGTTGFLGKILLEKILRSCSDVKKVYILLRDKKGKTTSERCTTLFEKPLFDRLKEEHPFYETKLCSIIGDCEQPDLGLNDADKKLLLKEVTTIFHVAATVKFNEPLATAARINVRSVRDLIKMAKQMDQLKSFVHVSTAYSNCNREIIDEKFYPSSISGDKLLSMIDLLDDDLLDAMTPKLTTGFPNTYVYTKALAENYIKENVESLPVAIVRPGSIFPTLEDPISGWMDTVYGPIGVAAGIGLGIIRSVYVDETINSEFVPADFVVSNIIAAAWSVGKKSEKNLVIQNESSVPIFNYTATPQNTVSYTDLKNTGYKMRWICPTSLCIWYPFVLCTTNPILFDIYKFILHKIPGYFFDLILMAVGKKPTLISIYKKVDKFQDSLRFFAVRQWSFSNNNTQKLWKELSDEDKKIFKFDMSSFDWGKGLSEMTFNLRIFLSKDTPNTIPYAIKKMYLLWAAHYLLIGFILFLLLKILTSIIL